LYDLIKQFLTNFSTQNNLLKNMVLEEKRILENVAVIFEIDKNGIAFIDL
jgi:hypothetical protein